MFNYIGGIIVCMLLGVVVYMYISTMGSYLNDGVKAVKEYKNVLAEEGCVVKTSYFGLVDRWECPDGRAEWR